MDGPDPDPYGIADAVLNCFKQVPKAWNSEPSTRVGIWLLAKLGPVWRAVRAVAVAVIITAVLVAALAVIGWILKVVNDPGCLRHPLNTIPVTGCRLW